MPSHTPAERLRAAIQRILTGLNDALNKPREGADVDFRTLSREEVLARAGPERRADLAASLQAVEELQSDEAPPRREVYTSADARTFLADSQRMAETLWGQSTGRQPSVADRNAISAYLVDNLLREERGAPANGLEEIAQQAVETQGAAVREFPERALFGQRLRASADAQLQSGLIDQETFNAIIFPATPFADVPAEFRASVPASGAATRQTEIKALGVVNHFQANYSEILRRSVDEPNVRDFREAVGNLVSAQTDEDIVEGRNLFSAPESASQIRARERAEGAADLFTKEGNLGRAVEDLLRQSGRGADPSLILDKEDKEAATRAKRMFTEGLKQFRSEILAESPGISDEALAGQLADFANSFVEGGQFDQLQTAVSEAFQAQKFTTRTGILEALGEIADEAGLDIGDIAPGRLEQIVQQTKEAGGIDPEGFVNAFPLFQQEKTAEEARTPAGANRLRDQALFNLGESPSSFTPEQLAGMSRQIAQRGTAEGFEELLAPNIQQLKRGRVLEGLFPPGRPGRQFGPDTFPTFEELDALGSEGLGVAPTGNIAPLRAGQTQTSSTVRGRIRSQLGLSGVNLPVQRSEPLPGFGEITPLLREAAGDNLAFLNFLFQPEQLRGLQAGFGAARRQEVREQRGRIQTTGEGLSRDLAPIRRNLATLENALGSLGADAGLDEAGIRRQENLLGQQTRLRGERDRIRGQIGTASTLQRMASSSLTVPQFLESRIGGLRQRFAASPAGLQEERRAEREAESDRRRRLRGGRTVFQRI